jgi:hypothetical protein
MHFKLMQSISPKYPVDARADESGVHAVHQADQSMDKLHAELASAGIVQGCPEVRLSEFVGAHHISGRALVEGDMTAEPSLANIRTALSVFCILPLGSAYVHDRLTSCESSLAIQQCVSLAGGNAGG